MALPLTLLRAARSPLNMSNQKGSRRAKAGFCVSSSAGTAKVSRLRDHAMPGAVPAAAAEALQQLVHAVERAAHGSAQHQQAVAAAHEAEAVFAQGLDVGRAAEELPR